MVEIRVAQHMAEQPHIEQRICQGGAVDTEGVQGRPSSGDPVQQQDTQGQQEKGQDHRRIVLQLFHGALLPAGRGGVVFFHLTTDSSAAQFEMAEARERGFFGVEAVL